MDSLTARHRKEQRDLQSQITQKKKSASKKTRKTVNDECAALEAELKARQAREVGAQNGAPNGHGEGEVGDVAEEEEELGERGEDGDLLDALAGPSSLEKKTGELTISHSRPAAEEKGADLPSQPRNPNRQKARLARRAAEQEDAARQAAEEATNLPDLKARERTRMVEEFTRRGLQEKEVAANGHCMYSAIADQMRQIGLGLDAATAGNATGEATGGTGMAGAELRNDDYKTVRQAAATYMTDNPDDFAPFLEEPLEKYVRKVRDTSEWGGQLELMALAKTYGLNIHVLQGDGRIEEIGSGEAEPKGEAWLAYYRHGFGLGEHYNSLRKAETEKAKG